MSIVLLILKIIGIVLLSVIGLVLVLLLLVLFVPLRYRLYANKKEESEFQLNAIVTWLLHFINIHANYIKELTYYVRVIVFKIYRSDNLKKETQKKDKNITSNNKEDGRNSTLLSDNEPHNNASIDLNESDNESINKNLVNNDDDIDELSRTVSDEISEEGNEGKLSFIDKIFVFTEKTIDFIFNFSEKIENITKKITDIGDNIDYYIEALEDEKNKDAFALCLNKTSKVLKHIAPKKIKGNLTLGFDDPYNMGQMLTIYGILYPIIYDKIQFVPEYDRNVFEGDLLIKGRITIAVLLWALFILYFNKDVRRMIKMFKNE